MSDSVNAIRPHNGKLRLEPPFEEVELAYLDWGEPAAERRVLCVHGVTRNAHDFDVLAAALAEHGARVIAVDMVGRGASSWLDDAEGYQIEVYIAQLTQFIEKLDLAPFDWIGTSMGGLIGMVFAASDNSPIKTLVINDIGPFVPKSALDQIITYLGLDLHFADIDEVERHLRFIHAPFGHLTDAQWRALAEHGSKRSDGGYRLTYDPRVREQFKAAAESDIELWEIWDNIKCPTYILRGNESNILTFATAEAMKQRGPKADVATFSGVGHAPALMSNDQIFTVRRWLHI